MTTAEIEAKRILIVEDEALIALELPATLVDEGYCVVGPCTRLDQAMALAYSATIDAALLDVRLVNDFIWPVADVLVARAIPFAYLTGYDNPIPDDRSNAPVLHKPIDMTEVIEGVRALLQPFGR